METAIHIVESILFLCMGISVVYLFIFAFASLFKSSHNYQKAKKQHRFAILFPAYKEDKVIESSISTFLTQKYPQDLYTVVVISDQMKDETNDKLTMLGATVLKANYENSSKAKALQLAVNTLNENKYDVVVIMDGDNMVEPDFLDKVNDAYDAGYITIQTHRLAKNRNTSTAILDAVSEEINNSIFRKGHVKLGFTSALIGSGMAFEYKWFKKNIFRVSTAGEDKELEALLLKQQVYTQYLDGVKVYDEKISTDAAFYNQRRRWLASQFSILKHALPDLPKAIATRNWDYCDKIFQWMMLPRVLLLGGIGFFALLITFYNWTWAIKWWSLLLFLIFTLFLAIPRYLFTKDLAVAALKTPWLALLMFLNLFRLRGVNKKFIHTDHEA